MIGEPSLMPPCELLTSATDIADVRHAHYPSATHTLCGKELHLIDPPHGRWPAAPTCPICDRTARAFDDVDASAPPHWRYRPRRLRAAILEAV